MNRAGRTTALVVAVCGLVLLLHAAHFGHTCDDAFISFTYARNWALGHGLVFNPGETVMGFSNLSWVLLLGIAERLGVAAPDAAHTLGAVLAVSTVAVVARHLALRGDPPAAIVIAVLFMVLNGTFALWVLGGLEGHLFTLLLTLLVVAAGDDAVLTDRRRAAGVGVLLGLLSITRPEGAMYAVPVAAYLALRRDGTRRPAPALVAAIVFVTIYAAFTLWKLLYYGDVLPNTYYAKMQPLGPALLARGLVLTRAFLAAYLWTPPVVVCAWLVLTQRSTRRRWLPLAVIATFSAFFLRVGGDGLVYHRLWLPVIPMLALLLADVVADASRASSGRRRLVTAGAGLCVALQLPASLWGRDLDYLRRDDADVRDLREIARYLDGLGVEVVAVNIVGSLGYHGSFTVLDMLGLTDRHIARRPKRGVGIAGHESHDGAYVLERAPDVILTQFPRLTTTPPPREALLQSPYPSDHDLFVRRSFHERYRYVAAAVDDRFLGMFVRNDLELDP